jgi:hypothetical protein
MTAMIHPRSAALTAFSLVMMAAGARAQAVPPDLVGLWEAKRRFGPDVAGRLVVDRPAGEWRASIAARTATVRVANDSVAFDFPDGSGAFLGRLDSRNGRITGHWIQPRTVADGFRYASPIALESCGTGCFAGTVAPRADELTFWLDIKRRADGTLGALLRNPERNLARFIRVDHIQADGSAVRLLDARDTVVATGVLRANGVMTVYFPNRGGSYDFRRVPDGAFTFFYPRGRPVAPYSYTPPPDRGDGWPVGTLEDAGISREQVSTFVQTLASAPVDSLGALKVHGLLIARHGRLVLEEYFYGENGDKPHETRSASKSVAPVLIGAAMQTGAPIGPSTSAYGVMRPDAAASLDARKRALTLDHLLTMSSGLDCDDNGDDRPGNETAIIDQEENPDWYGMILDLDVVRDPGAQAIYCSINPHLAGGVLARATGRSLPDLIHPHHPAGRRVPGRRMALSPARLHEAGPAVPERRHVAGPPHRERGVGTAVHRAAIRARHGDALRIPVVAAGVPLRRPHPAGLLRVRQRRPVRGRDPGAGPGDRRLRRQLQRARGLADDRGPHPALHPPCGQGGLIRDDGRGSE